MLTVTRSQLAALVPRALSDALERGEIVFFPETPLELPGAADLAFLRDGLAAHLERKNPSYYPEADRLVGLRDPAAAERARALLRACSARVRALLARSIPELAAGWRVGTSSFRPLQERGRGLSPHASNELVHIDAGAYGATHGDRILRFFTNVHSSEDRVWASKGSFVELYRRWAAEAGLAPPLALAEGPLDRLYSRALAAAAVAAPMARMLDTSPYDRAMRRFHNFMKDTPAFQRDPAGHVELRFPPGSSWMVLTDTVSHACTSGQHAFVDTFLVPLANCRLREHAPYHVMSAA